MKLDIASPEIIAGTSSEWQNHVRLYFRPRTPTQFNNEGSRPLGQQSRNSHCPVPVYLIFGAESILSLADCRFSNGNVGSNHASVGESISFLQEIPFDLVYHDSAFNSSDRDLRDRIVLSRNAEVLVPNQLNLENLLFIVCRSEAEYETLLYFLPPLTRSRWMDKIGVRTDLRLFFRQWTFVEHADLSNARTIFRFNPNSKLPRPFRISVELVEYATGKKYIWSREEYSCQEHQELHLTNVLDPYDYTVRLKLDGQLAYANRYQADDLPF